MSIIHSWKHCRSFETFCMAWPEIWLPQFVYLRHEILSHDCVKYFPLYSPKFIQLLITHTKIKWVKYIPTFITNAESTANRISLLYFVELVVILPCCLLIELLLYFWFDRNPSSGSLVISETGSLDRTKSSGEKRKKGTLDDEPRVSDRVEVTRVNPNVLIDEIWKDTKLDQLAESAESECT